MKKNKNNWIRRITVAVVAIFLSSMFAKTGNIIGDIIIVLLLLIMLEVIVYAIKDILNKKTKK